MKKLLLLITTVVVAFVSNAQITLTNSTVEILCSGSCDGEIHVSASGSIHEPFQYSYDGGSTFVADTFSLSMCAGSYTVIVKDTLLQADTLVIILTDPAALVASIDATTNVTCFGLNDGSITASATGGTTNYIYNWSSGGTATTEVGLVSGSYSLTVTDANGCNSTVATTISEPTALTITMGGNDENCGNGDGVAYVMGSGGTLPYTYLWDNASTSDTLPNLFSGTYSVTITDANACSETSSFVVNSTPAPTANAGIDQAFCAGQVPDSLSGQVTVATGGTWTTSGTGAFDDPNSLMAVYTPSVADEVSGSVTLTLTTTGNGACASAQSTMLLTINSAVKDSLPFTDESSGGACDGTASFFIQGGVSYFWQPGAMTTQSVNSLCAGQYYVTATDANGCSIPDSLVIGTAASCNLVVSTTITDDSGAGDGQVAVSASGGTPPYQYAWDGNTPDSLNVFSNLSGGGNSYSLIVLDAGSCSDTSIVTVNTAAGCSLVVNYNLTHESSAGASDGVAQAIVTGGTPPYDYAWNGTAPDTLNNVSGLTAGSYQLIVSDAAACVDTSIYNITITGGCNLMMDSLIINDETVPGASDGSASIYMSGGTPPYSYSWLAPFAAQTSQTAVGLTTSDFLVSVSDAGGCVYTDSIHIMSVWSCNISLTYNVTDESQPGASDGSATVNAAVSNGGTPYIWLWSTGDSTATITGLSTGSYLVSVAGDDGGQGCVAFDSIFVGVGVPCAITATASEGSPASCFGGNDGSATVAVNGGASPFTYNWSNGQSGATIPMLSAGSYTVTVTDDNACISSSTAVITQATPISVTAVTTNSTCGNANGSATVSALGGAGTYTYLWVGGNTTTTITGVQSGSYAVTVTDINTCSKVKNVQIGDTDGPTVTLTVVANSNCGGADGEITAAVSGGTAPFTYLWSNGVTASHNYTAEPGQNTLAVTDALGCVGTDNVTIISNGTNPPVITGNVTSLITGFTITQGTVSIYADNPYGNAMNLIATTNITSSGNYTFNNITPIGGYILLAAPDTSIPAFNGNIPTFNGPTHRWDSALVTNTVCDSTFVVNLQSIYLVPLNGTSTLGGTILYDGTNKNGSRAGDPIPGVDISLEQIPGGIIAHTETDVDGGFTFANVPVSDSSYTIHVDYPGLPMEDSYVVDVQSDTVANDLDFLVGDSTVYIPAATTSISEVSVENKSQVRVYPNPFDGVTTIQYMLKENSKVTIEVFNVLGELVYSENSSNRMAGNYITNLTAQQLGGTSSVYIAKVTIGNDVHTTRLVQSK